MTATQKDLVKQYKKVFKPIQSPTNGNKCSKMPFERFSVYKPANLTYTAGTTRR